MDDKQKGKKRPQSGFTRQVRNARLVELATQGKLTKELAAFFGINRTTVSRNLKKLLNSKKDESELSLL